LTKTLKNCYFGSWGYGHLHLVLTDRLSLLKITIVRNMSTKQT